MAKKVEVAMNAPIEKDDGMPLLHAEGCQSSCAKWVVVLIVAALLVLAGVLL
jgi:hypothetical protein